MSYHVQWPYNLLYSYALFVFVFIWECVQNFEWQNETIQINLNIKWTLETQLDSYYTIVYEFHVARFIFFSFFSKSNTNCLQSLDWHMATAFLFISTLYCLFSLSLSSFIITSSSLLSFPWTEQFMQMSVWMNWIAYKEPNKIKRTEGQPNQSLNILEKYSVWFFSQC